MNYASLHRLTQIHRHTYAQLTSAAAAAFFATWGGHIISLHGVSKIFRVAF